MDRGDEIVTTLMDICRKEGILSAYYSGIGGCSDVEMQVFIPERGEFETENVEGTLELVSLMGNVVSDDSDQLFHHTHALFTWPEDGEHKSVSGHMKSATELFTLPPAWQRRGGISHWVISRFPEACSPNETPFCAMISCISRSSINCCQKSQIQK